MKATFYERLASYIIDFLIVSSLLSIICYKLPDNSSTYIEEINTIYESYTNNEITPTDFADKYLDIVYNEEKKDILTPTISVILTIGYFIVFQYLNNGQTLGKKILKIQVVDKNTNTPPSILKGTIRTIFILNIASNIITIILRTCANKNTYLITSTILSIFNWIFLVITIVLMISKSSCRGLHDLMANTIVIKERSWYNAWINRSRIN